MRKKCVINVKNKDNLCFLYAVKGSISLPASHKDRHSNYNISTLYSDGFTFPMSIDDIGKFEEANSLGVDVYSFENEEK